MPKTKEKEFLYHICPLSMAGPEVRKCRDKGECWLWDAYYKQCLLTTLALKTTKFIYKREQALFFKRKDQK